MRFPLFDQLALACRLERVAEGRPHRDGRRYLPTLFFRLGDAAPGGLLLAVTDRHHRVDLALVGRSGAARLAFMLGVVRLQRPPFRQGLVPEQGAESHGYSRQPGAFGRVLAVPAWEADREHLPYEALYVELLLDVGVGAIGVRTSATADDLAASIGAPRIEPGDWVEVGPSRIDVLEFVPS
jgi:hypothetical protein